MKHLILSVLVCLGVSFGYTQTEGSVFTSTGRGVSTTFASDYQSLGINPANLAWTKEFKGKRVALGFLETGFSLSSPILNNPIVNESASIPFSFGFDSDASFTDFQEFSSDLQEGMRLNADVRLFGIAVTTKIAGFGFSVNERYAMNVQTSKDFADIASFGFGSPYFDTLVYSQGGSTNKVVNTPQTYDSLRSDTSVQLLAGIAGNPKTIPELMEGTQIKVSWIREFNFGFGTNILKTQKFGLYAGVGIKYLQGMALLDMEASNNNLNGFISYSPSLAGGSGNPGLFSSGNIQYKLPKAAGSGFGVDLGVNVKAFKRIKIGVAVNDIGSITWTENTYSAQADSLLSTFRVKGFYADSGSFQSNSGGATFDSILNNLVDIRAANFTKKVNLPSTFRLGASIQFGKFLEIGGEVVTPLNDRPGNLVSSVYSFGGDLKLGPVILSSGIVLQNKEVLRVPVGIVFSTFGGLYEIGFSTRDIQSLINLQEQENPIISAAFGFLRFRI